MSPCWGCHSAPGDDWVDPSLAQETNVLLNTHGMPWDWAFQSPGVTRMQDPGWAPVIVGSRSWTWAAILTRYGFFRSRSQARKAGWTGTPVGFHDVQIGKLRRRLTVWNSAPWLGYWRDQTGLTEP